ncbi:MAG: hypothetical protein V4580_14970 [Bacteroidota bacterium]
MKKIVLVVAALTCLLTTVDAQKKEKAWKEIAYKDITSEFDEMTVSTNNGVSNAEMTKFKLKITNKTNDVLLFKPEESVIKAAKEVKPKEKWLYVYPSESEFRVVNSTGPDYLMPYSYVMSGMYKISISGKGIEAPNFQLPASQNEFTVGAFSCTMASLTKESDKTEVKFECKYTGDKVGVIQPGRSAVKLPDGTEIANEKSKSQPIILMKGKTEKVTFKWNRMEGGKAQDMQKIKLEILFRNTFSEVELEKMKDEIISFEIDEALSKK